VNAKLSPTEHFEKLLHGADPAGQSNEAIRQLAMSALRSCIELTTRNSDKPRCATSLLTSAFGITPVT